MRVSRLAIPPGRFPGPGPGSVFSEFLPDSSSKMEAYCRNPYLRLRAVRTAKGREGVVSRKVRFEHLTPPEGSAAAWVREQARTPRADLQIFRKRTSGMDPFKLLRQTPGLSC